MPKAGRLYGHNFRTERGVNQVDPVSPTVFNIVVDAVVRAVLIKVCVPQEAHHGLRWAALQHNLVLYVNDGRIVGCNPI